MYKRALLVFSIVLFLAGAVKSQDEPLEVINYSFEYDCNGALVTWKCRLWKGDCLMGWKHYPEEGWAAAVHESVNNQGATDGEVNFWINGGVTVYQVTPNIIEPGRHYMLLFDTKNWETYCDVLLFYPEDMNYPDANHVDFYSESLYFDTGYGTPLPWGYDYGITFTSIPGSDYIGKPLGIKFYNPNTGSNYWFLDNVRLKWSWACSAYNPTPADNERYVLQDKNLGWIPGLWADQHILYFGTDWEDVNNRSRTGDANDYFGDSNSFEPETMELGETYYWSVTEVNNSYVSQPGVSSPPWIGDIWSFTVEGAASNPFPEDGANDQSVDAVLSWTQGTASQSHDVYFGADFNDVRDANREVTLGVYKHNWPYEVNSWDPPGRLDLEQTYYWRIDEVRNGSADIIKGYIWRFTVADYMVIDDMESYGTGAAQITYFWESIWGNSTAQISLQTVDGDANYVHGGEQSMEYWYTNYSSPFVALAEFQFESPQDWTVAGFKALTLYLRGDFDNEAGAAQDLYVQVSDDTNTGSVQYEDSNDLLRGWMDWQEWNIELQEFVDDNSVNLSAVTTLGIKVGDGNTADEGYIYFDDIRLYPTRCVVDKATGSFTNDCDVDIDDLEILVRDWLISGIGSVAATEPNTTGLYGYWKMNDNAEDPNVLDDSGNENHGVLYDDVDANDPVEGYTKNHYTSDAIAGSALEFDGIDDYVELPALNSSTNTITITAWVKREHDGHMYDGIVMSSNVYDPCDEIPGPNYTAGLQFGSDTSDWTPNYELSFMWTGSSWSWHTELFVPPQEWTFTALTVAPDVATIYLYDGIALQAARNYDTYEPLPWNTTFHIADQMQYGPPSESNRFFPGIIDEVRIYTRTLSPEEIASLAGLSSAEIVIEPWRANADGDEDVDLVDYAMMADNWLTEVLFGHNDGS